MRERTLCVTDKCSLARLLQAAVRCQERDMVAIYRVTLLPVRAALSAHHYAKQRLCQHKLFIRQRLLGTTASRSTFDRR